MGRHKWDPIIECRVSALLDLGWSELRIIDNMKKRNTKISKGVIYEIKNRGRKTPKDNENKRSKIRLQKNDKKVIEKLEKMAEKIDPPLQRHMAKVLGCSQPNMSYLINNAFNLKKRKKKFSSLFE
jgi:hypothetical protein